jgi:hypothetical protein
MSALEKLLSKKINNLVLDRKLAVIKQSLSLCLCPEKTVCESLMNTTLRDDALQLVDSLTDADSDVYLDKTHLLKLSRMPISSMSRSDALEIIYKIIKNNIVLKTSNIDLELDLLKKSNDFESWSPALERTIYQLRKTESTDFDSKYLVLLCSPTWREEIGFKAKLIGQPFQLREAQKIKKEYPKIKKNGNLQSATTLYLQLDDFSIITQDQEKIKLSAYPNLQNSVIVPSHPILLELKSDHIVVWSWGETSEQKYAQQTLQHSISDATFIDAIVCVSGIILIQVGSQNIITGGLADSESIVVRYDTKSSLLHPDDISLDDMDVQDTLDTKRKEGNQIDFRDHSSLLSAELNNNGSSKIYFGSHLLLEFEDVVVGALGCAQEFYIVFANGLIHTYHDLVNVSEFDTGKSIRACII